MAYYTITYLIGISTVCHIRALSDLFKMYIGGSLHSAIRVRLFQKEESPKTIFKIPVKQECIPVGGVPSAAVAIPPLIHAPPMAVSPAMHAPPLLYTPPCHTCTPAMLAPPSPSMASPPHMPSTASYIDLWCMPWHMPNN